MLGVSIYPVLEPGGSRFSLLEPPGPWLGFMLLGLSLDLSFKRYQLKSIFSPFQNPHTWGTFHNIFEALLRCFKCVQVESLKKHQNKCEFRHPQLWGFWTISRPPKNHFFWNWKKIEIRPGVAGTVRNGPESIWKGSPITFDTFL